MATPTIEEIYDKEIRPRSRQERERLVELASKDLESELGNPEYDRTHELFEQWRKEDSKMTPEEIEHEQMLWEKFKENINAERDRAGARRIY